jgi:uncharacterized protein YkwD
MKKKIIFSSILLATVIALVIAMVLAVSACSSSETAPTNAQIENSSENTVDNNTSLESSFDNSSESKISEKSNIESSINSSVSSNSQNSKVENSKKETQNSNSSSKPTETSKSSNTSTNSSSNSKVPSNDSSSKPSSGGSSSGSSSSSSSTPSHSHSYSSKTVKATCTSDGYTVHTCSCGASYTDNYTSATGHKWSEWKTVKKATTSSEGRKQRTCSSCGKTESKTIAKVQGSSTSGGHKITGARKAVYSYRGMDSFSSVNLVDLINAERAKEGLGKLEWTADLLQQDYNEDPEGWSKSCFDSKGKFDPYRVAEVKEPLQGAQKMADMGFATHGEGVGCSCVGESRGASTIEEALRRQIKAYMESPSHRASLMNAGSHSVTAAYAIDSNGTVYTAILVGG